MTILSILRKLSLIIFITVSFSSFSYGKSYMDNLPPLELQKDLPMPQISPAWKKGKTTDAGVCFGVPIARITMVSQDKEGHTYFFVLYTWRSSYPIFAVFASNWELISLWVDHNDDNVAEEYYYNWDHYRAEYGKSAWLCAALEKLLER